MFIKIYTQDVRKNVQTVYYKYNVYQNIYAGCLKKCTHTVYYKCNVY